MGASADEDLNRQSDSKTSAVHFLRFELSPATIAAAEEGGGILVGIEHRDCGGKSDTSRGIRDSLIRRVQ